MGIKTSHWKDQIDEITDDFNRIFEPLTPSELNWKPNPGTWSIAQNIDHLIVINESYFQVFAQLREGKYEKPFWARFDFIPRFFGNAILKSVQPDQKRKVKTVPQWEPTVHTLDGQILKAFENHQEKLKSEIDQSTELLEKETVISSPTNRNIVYRLDKAFDIIVTHERRHFEQAKDILNQLKQSK